MPDASDSFSATGSKQTWTVPDYVDLVRLKCNGAGGAGGSTLTLSGGSNTSTADQDGDPGGYAQGDATVTPGQTLNLYVGTAGTSGGSGGWPNGGAGGDKFQAQGGDGGGSTDVRQGGDTPTDRIIVAGGGGGGGAATAVSDGGPDTRSGGGGAGGGQTGSAEDGGDADAGSGTASSGGTGAGETDLSGAGGASDQSKDPGGRDKGKAAGGGGGGGYNGGGGGGAGADAEDNDAWASGAGGGGGSGLVAGLSNATSTLGGGASANSDGSLTIEYSDRTTDLSASTPTDDEIELSWTPASDADSQDLYRAQASGSQVGDYTKIADLAAGTGSFTDTGLEDGEQYFYRVQNVNSFDNRLSNEVSATTTLPAPSGTDVSDTGNDELTVSWTNNDDSSDGTITVFRSTDGSLGSEVFSTSDLSTTSYTDTGLTDDTKYVYTVRRETDHATADGTQTSAINDFPAPTDFSIDATNGDQFDISWTDNSDNEDGYRVLVSTDGGSTFTDDSGLLAANTESYTTTDLLDGRTYAIKARAVAGDTTADSGTDSDTTVLPDADQPVLGNGVEDEISVDRESQVHDNGSIRWQVRETGESSWDSNAVGFDEGTVAFDTITFDITGREDGEEYEVRLRTETDDLDGAWTTPVAITTQFPGVTDLSTANVTQTSADLSWTDNSDNEDGFDVERRKQTNGSWGPWQTVAELAADTTTYTDDGLQPGRTYEHRIEAFTDDAEATSGTVQTTATSSGVRQDRVPSSGWYVEVDHSDGSTLTPRLASDPQVDQTVNGLPELRIPVPYDTTWQDAGFEDATVRAYRDGQPQPVDTLVSVDVREGGGEKRTVLTAEGGSELKQRVTKNVRFEDADVVARDLVDNNTSLTTNVDDPASSTTEVLMQDADSDSEWQDIIPAHPFPSDDPRHITGGELRVYDTALFRRGEDFDGSTNWSQFFADRFESGEAYRESGINNDISWDITTAYTIPSNHLSVHVRFDYIDTTHPGVVVDFGGEQAITFDADADIFGGGSNGPRWLDGSVSSDFSGTQTLTINVDAAAADNSNIYVDAVAIVDERYTTTENNETLTNGGQLSWPELGPDSIQTETEDTTALNQVVAGRIDSTWDNTANNQQIEASNDQGGSWEVSATNSETADGSFSSDSGQIRGRLTQSYYDSGSGPVEFDAAQSVDLWQLFADQEDTPVLIDRSFDDRLITILQVIADDKNFLWELQVDRDYTFSFEMTQPGQRTSDRDTDVVSYDISKSTADVIEKAVIKGGRQSRRQEDFTSDHDTLVGLAQDDLVEGTEAVYDADTGEQFDRGDDYEMDYLDGQIEVLSTGTMSDSTTYQIDYDYKPQASFTKAGVTDPKTIVRSIPSLQNEQTAEQLAQTLVTKFGGPIYEATVTIPDTVGWSVIDEVDPDKVPAAGERLQVKALETTPEAVVGQFASRESADAFIERVRQRLGRTETRV